MKKQVKNQRKLLGEDNFELRILHLRSKGQIDYGFWDIQKKQSQRMTQIISRS